ncbi:MAG: glycosyltransferase family 2 protein [Pseudomonadota bacterium]
MPSVSVIIPVYRAEKFIVRSVTSLFAQTFTDWEAIIVSDDKFDYQKFLAKHNITDKRLRFGSTGKVGSGPSNARNIALDMAKSNIIATLDADDTFDKRKLAMTVPMAEKYGMVVSNIRVIDDETNEKLQNLHYSTLTRVIKYNELLAITSYTHSTIVFKKPKKTIYYTDKVNYCEDLLFMSQIYDHSSRCFYFRHKLHNYYLHKDSLCQVQDSYKNFSRDRSLLISMLKKHEVHIKNKTTRDMLISFLQAGYEINKKYGREVFSYERYLIELKKYCTFLPISSRLKFNTTTHP